MSKRWQGAGTALVALAGLAAFAPAAGQETDAREQQATRYLRELFGAEGRRMHPTPQQLEWRRQAGVTELSAWPSEIVLRQIEPVLRRFFGALQGRAFDPRLTASIFTPDFRGTALASAAVIDAEPAGLSRSRWKPSAAPVLDRSAFAADWQARYQQFERIVRTEHHVDRLQALGDESTRRLLVPFRVTGFRHSRGYEDQGEMLVDLRWQPDSNRWQIGRLELLELETLASPSAFTAQALVRVSPPVDAPLGAFVDYFAQGVSVVDLDGDGDADIFAPSRFTAPRVFINGGERRFTERADELGFAPAIGARSGYFFDWDNDGDQDALVLTFARLFLFEQRDGRFVDISAESGFDRISTYGLTGATIADYDRDGLLDFYVANYGDPANGPLLDYFDSRRGFKNQLFRNTGAGRFRMVTREAGLDDDNARWSFAAISFDYDGDDWQDIYVVNDYGPNQLFRNLGGLRFEEVTASAGASDFGNGMGVSLGDLDNDGREDLYVSNMLSHSGMRIADSEDFAGDDAARARLHQFAKGNTLLLGTGDAVFLETPASELSDAKWAWGNTLFDYDNDGDLDVYVANGMYSNLARADVDPVFWRHLLAPISRGIAPPEYAPGYFAYLIQQESQSFAGYERNRLFQNFGDLTFRDVAPVLGADLVQDGRGVAAADLDGDGRLDLVVSNRNAPSLVVLWNEAAHAGHYLSVELKGTRANRNGAGARVELTCAGRTQVRTLVIGTGYVSQEPHTAWFGTGNCAEVDSVSVTWPGGGRSVLGPVAADQALLVEESPSSGSNR